MSTKFNTLVRSAVLAALTSVVSTVSVGATFNSQLLATSIIKPVLITDLLTEQPTTETEFAGRELLEKIGRYSGTPMVYQAVGFDKDPVAKSVVFLKRLNEKFNTDRFIHLENNWFGFQSENDPSASFEFDSRTGNIRFNAGLKPYSGEEQTADLPKSPDEIIKFAAKYLIELELLPPLTEINGQKIEFGGLNMAIPDDKGGSKIFEKLKTVRAYRVLNGMEVEGDSRLVMNFGEKGKLAGIVSQWSKVGPGEPLTESDLIPAEKLREAAIANIQRVISKTQNPELAEVKLVLYDDGNGVIEPAYHFIVKRTIKLGDSQRTVGATDTMVPYDFYLPISNKSRAEFPDLETVRVQPLDGRDQNPIKIGQDE